MEVFLFVAVSGGGFGAVVARSRVGGGEEGVPIRYVVRCRERKGADIGISVRIGGRLDPATSKG